MNILCVSLLDNGGSLQQLSNALNRYTEHDSIHLNYQPTWLGYDIDIDGRNQSKKELLSIIGDREFFIFSECVPPQFKELGVKLTRDNMILRCFGSITRSNLPLYRNMWSERFTTIASGGFDPTIHPYLGFIAYHIPNIYEFSDFPKRKKVSNKLRICQTATNPVLKSTAKVVEVFQELEKHYDIETLITNKIPWKQSLEIKATCDITVDQFTLGTYASSAIESMYLGHVVVSRLSPFVRSMHPDIPIIQAEEDTLYAALEGLILMHRENPDKFLHIKEISKAYAVEEHEAERNIEKWTHLIDWVSTGFR